MLLYFSLPSSKPLLDISPPRLSQYFPSSSSNSSYDARRKNTLDPPATKPRHHDYSIRVPPPPTNHCTQEEKREKQFNPNLEGGRRKHITDRYVCAVARKRLPDPSTNTQTYQGGRRARVRTFQTQKKGKWGHKIIIMSSPRKMCRRRGEGVKQSV